jgi:hypothetical protein
MPVVPFTSWQNERNTGGALFPVNSSWQTFFTVKSFLTRPPTRVARFFLGTTYQNRTKNTYQMTIKYSK